MEQGIAPGLTSEFVQPLDASENDERLLVCCSENSKDFLLMNSNEVPLLYATVDSTGEKFDIYITEPGDPPSALGPAFSLRSLNSKRDEWSLESAKCERCQSLGRRSCGVRELMRISHYVEYIGDGKACCMDVQMPAPESDGQGDGVVWCSACSSQQPRSASCVAALTTRRPKWLPRKKALTMNFYDRVTMSSTMNFMLDVDGEQDPNEQTMKLLFGKVGQNLYALDYRRPFGMVQAFAAALSSAYWE